MLLIAVIGRTRRIPSPSARTPTLLSHRTDHSFPRTVRHLPLPTRRLDHERHLLPRLGLAQQLLLVERLVAACRTESRVWSLAARSTRHRSRPALAPNFGRLTWRRGRSRPCSSGPACCAGLGKRRICRAAESAKCSMGVSRGEGDLAGEWTRWDEPFANVAERAGNFGPRLRSATTEPNSHPTVLGLSILQQPASGHY